jgi:peroxiredoxin
VVALSGCATESDSIAEQYRAGDGKNYIAGDGRITELAPEERGDPIRFEAPLDVGGTVDTGDYLGSVLVLNIWYAGCAPCRAEAPDLQQVWEEFEGRGVQFLGVNVRDQASTALAFAETYGITYPSVLDLEGGAAQLALSGTVAPSAVPTTLVIDKQGRTASRILGRIENASILRSLVLTALEED